MKICKFLKIQLDNLVRTFGILFFFRSEGSEGGPIRHELRKCCFLIVKSTFFIQQSPPALPFTGDLSRNPPKSARNDYVDYPTQTQGRPNVDPTQTQGKCWQTPGRPRWWLSTRSRAEVRRWQTLGRLSTKGSFFSGEEKCSHFFFARRAAVDIEKCCKMSIYVQKSVSIQKRTSPDKFDNLAEKSG